jgi:DNA-binding NarL/FixJ family response regulator
MTERARCLIVDERPVVRVGVRGMLDERYEIEEATDGSDAIELADVNNFDVAIVDMQRPAAGPGTLSGSATIRALRKVRPDLAIVAHGNSPERHIVAEAVAAGASAYVMKSSPPEELGRAVDAALESETFIDPAAGRRTITKRQCQILQLMADGDSTARIAKRLGLSTETVRTHSKNLLARLGARDRAHAVAIGFRNALIE